MIAEFQIIGAPLFRLQADKINERAREVPTVAQRWQAPSRNQFVLGQAPDGWPNMRIVGIEPMEEIEGLAYEIRLDCEGTLRDELFIETSLEEDLPEEGWDQLHRSIFTRFPDHEWFRKLGRLIDPYTGLVVPGFEWFWAMDRGQRRHRAKDYYEIDLVFKGVKGDKPVKRRIGTTPQTVSSKFTEGLAVMSFPVYEGYPPLDTGKLEGFSGTDLGDFEADLASVSVTDTLISKTPPPTERVGSFWKPSDPPIVFLLAVGGIKNVIHLPYGWKVANMQSEQLAGAPLWLVTITWAYQVATTPSA